MTVELLKTAFVNGKRIRPGIYDELPKGYKPKLPGAYRVIDDNSGLPSPEEQELDAAPLTSKGQKAPALDEFGEPLTTKGE